jgi:hypothetical protein
MFRFITVAMALWLCAGTSLAAGQQATQAKQPAPPSAPSAASKPMDVNVLSLPPAVPAEVKVSNFPSADPAGGKLVMSTDKLVIATWALGLGTLFTAAVALVIAGAQGRETTRRDRDSMMREISRAATKVYATGRRVSDLSILALATVSGMTDMLRIPAKLTGCSA